MIDWFNIYISTLSVFQNANATYARAIYENIAESPDELAFKRGDVLTVIEQDTDGLTGWWLCSLRERTVIISNWLAKRTFFARHASQGKLLVLQTAFPTLWLTI